MVTVHLFGLGFSLTWGTLAFKILLQFSTTFIPKYSQAKFQEIWRESDFLVIFAYRRGPVSFSQFYRPNYICSHHSLLSSGSKVVIRNIQNTLGVMIFDDNLSLPEVCVSSVAYISRAWNSPMVGNGDPASVWFWFSPNLSNTCFQDITSVLNYFHTKVFSGKISRDLEIVRFFGHFRLQALTCQFFSIF